MFSKYRVLPLISGIFILSLSVISCSKKDKLTVGDYPVDANPPDGPLRFYAALDGGDVDSIRAVFGVKKGTVKYTDGVRGQAFVGDGDSYLFYPTSNGFVKATSFAVSFWEKSAAVPASDAQFVMSVPSTAGHWSNSAMLLIFDHQGAGSTQDSAVIKFMVADATGADHWFELTGANRLPGVFDNNWHHLVFSYDETSSEMSVYKDGQLWRNLAWDAHGGIVFPVSKINGFNLGGKTTDWGKGFIGGLDQFRLYGKAITSSEVQALFAGKM